MDGPGSCSFGAVYSVLHLNFLPICFFLWPCHAFEPWGSGPGAWLAFLVLAWWTPLSIPRPSFHFQPQMRCDMHCPLESPNALTQRGSSRMYVPYFLFLRVRCWQFCICLACIYIKFQHLSSLHSRKLSPVTRFGQRRQYLQMCQQEWMILLPQNGPQKKILMKSFREVLR